MHGWLDRFLKKCSWQRFAQFSVLVLESLESLAGSYLATTRTPPGLKLISPGPLYKRSRMNVHPLHPLPLLTDTTLARSLVGLESQVSGGLPWGRLPRTMDRCLKQRRATSRWIPQRLPLRLPATPTGSLQK